MTPGGHHRAIRLSHILGFVVVVNACSRSTLSGARPGVDGGDDQRAGEAGTVGTPDVGVDGKPGEGGEDDGGGPHDGAKVMVEGKVEWTRPILNGSVGDWDVAALSGGDFLIATQGGNRLTAQPDAGTGTQTSVAGLIARFQASGERSWGREVTAGRISVPRLGIGGSGFVLGLNVEGSGQLSVGPGGNGVDVANTVADITALFYDFGVDGVPVGLRHSVPGRRQAGLSLADGTFAFLDATYNSYNWRDSLASRITFSGSTFIFNQARIVATSDGRTAIVMDGAVPGSVSAEPTTITTRTGTAIVERAGRVLIAIVSPTTLHWAVAAGMVGLTGMPRWQVAASEDGGLFVVGSMEGVLDLVFEPGASGPLKLTRLPIQRPASFLARLSADGQYLWARLFDGARVAGVAVLSDGSAVVAGSATMGALLQVGSGNGTVSLPDANSTFVARYDRSGNLTWNGQTSTSTYVNPLDLRVFGLKDDSVLIGGTGTMEAPGAMGGLVSGLIMTRVKF